MKPQKKASDYNILVYFKDQELNSARAKGTRIPLKEHHDQVKRDDDLQDIFNDVDAMKALCQKYNEEKTKEKIVTVQVSKQAQAKSIVEKMNLLQQVADFMYKLSDANSFGMTNFHIGIQDVLNLYKSFVVTAEKMGTRKLYQSEMAMVLFSDVVFDFLKEITGIVNLSMSYVSFAKNIVVPYKVNIRGWSDNVLRAYPQQLAADQTKRLYNAWNSGEVEKNGELEPRVRKKHSGAGSKCAWGGDNGSDNSREDEDAQPTKGSKCKRAVGDDDKEGSDGGDDVQPQKKSGGGGKRARGRGRGGCAKKSASREDGAKKSAGSGRKKLVCATQKKSAAGVGRKAAGGGKKSSEPVGKGKKPIGKKRKMSQHFVISDSDSGSGEGDDNEDKEDDDAEFTD
ncbi:hypothetical protein BT96DRAFT_996465 [Gymnopus androsaceus JB14]|uniref:Uncharacterized protein n=1 Tax=Gymnopus androsaceus JB14 TaxID=1447944 RepID=A0A6A4HE59_9AGAR|nr:hypothetical protein BT96DRAFT_996465 [Gymnopus androsaceus JB14]